MKKEWIKNYRLLVFWGIVSLVLVSVVCCLVLLRQQAAANSEKVVGELFSQETTSTTSSTEIIAEGSLYVDVKGAVQSPGMYEISEGDRLQDVIQLAGGFSKEADDRQMNLSEKVTDQELIYVPKKGEKLAKETASEDEKKQAENSSESGVKKGSEKVNLNTADAAQLQELSGIGAKKAEEIIKYREENGSFKTINDLTKISGIGEKTVEKLKNSITI
ncbi:competence protein ComEA [Enterococcus sp. AZ194]|uniref:helix-hairpin-helix domain-containing protein n=1 Tax=Enterococcus sp. AZ194 TaxID=2774629 RepID=UPI003F286996